MIRRRMTNKKAASADYVTDGLLINLDGYDAPVLSKWVSRVNSYTFGSSNITYDSTNHKYSFAGSYGIKSDQAVTYGSHSVTIQIVDDGTIYSQTALAILAESDASFFNNGGAFVVDLSEVSMRAFIEINRVSSGYYGIKGNSAQTVNSKAQYTFIIGDNYRILKNGVELTGFSTYSNVSKGTPTIITPDYLYIGARNLSTYPCKLGLNAFRLYNKELSESEIATNLAIDKTRFNF